MQMLTLNLKDTSRTDNDQDKRVDTGNYPHLTTETAVLIKAVQKLSLARSLEGVMQIVRNAARLIANSDGATFVLRDRENDLCYYADEDAVAPLWKGRKFPAANCISGWAMAHKQRVIIRDIYLDDRIPHDAYRSTFVKSLSITPIRTIDPIGAIGTYWAEAYEPTSFELDALQALADAASIAMENIQMIQQLEQRVVDLERVNHQIGRLTWLASHDLKEPLRGIKLSSEQVELHMQGGELEKIPARLLFIKKSSDLVHRLVEDLLDVSRVENHQRSLRAVDTLELVKEVEVLLQSAIKESGAKIKYKNLPPVFSDPVLLSRVFQNLISNSIKFRKSGKNPEIEISTTELDGKIVFQIRDNGIGIGKDYYDKIFDYFTRLHSKFEYPGSGIGLAVSRRILEDSGNKIWVESKVGVGSSFFFTIDPLPK